MKSWEGASFCEDDPSCPAEGPHLHCDGPLPGDLVSYRRKGRDDTCTAMVRIHWHYEGCMIDVVGETTALVPELGDEVWPAEGEPLEYPDPHPED